MHLVQRREVHPINARADSIDDDRGTNHHCRANHDSSTNNNCRADDDRGTNDHCRTNDDRSTNHHCRADDDRGTNDHCTANPGASTADAGPYAKSHPGYEPLPARQPAGRRALPAVRGRPVLAGRHS